MFCISIWIGYRHNLISSFQRRLLWNYQTSPATVPSCWQRKILFDDFSDISHMIKRVTLKCFWFHRGLFNKFHFQCAQRENGKLVIDYYIDVLWVRPKLGACDLGVPLDKCNLSSHFWEPRFWTPPFLRLHHPDFSIGNKHCFIDCRCLSEVGTLRLMPVKRVLHVLYPFVSTVARFSSLSYIF